MSRYRFHWRGEDHFVDYQRIGPDLWFCFKGQIFQEPIQPKSGRSRNLSEAGPSNEIKAPMPGKVTKLLKQIGQKVLVGDSVLVMEAMKMEYTLKAEVEGVIEKIETHVNEQVSLGKRLAKIKMEAD